VSICDFMVSQTIFFLEKSFKVRLETTLSSMKNLLSNRAIWVFQMESCGFLTDKNIEDWSYILKIRPEP
jgi:hypothetical protein